MDEALEVLRSEKRKVEVIMSRLQQELSVISRQSSSRGALEALRRDKRAKEERYQTEMCSMEAELLTVLGHIPAPDDRDVPTQLENIERTKNRELQSSQEQFQKGRFGLSRLQTQLEETENQLKAKKRRVEALQGEVAGECGEDGAVYDQVMEKLRQDIETNFDDMSAVKGSLPFFRKSLEKIHSTRKCPLCTRGFSDHAGFEKTVKSITDRLNNTVPRLLPTLEGKQHQLQEKQKTLQELKPKIEELAQLRDREIPRLDAAKGQKEAEIVKLKTELNAMEEKVTGLRTNLEQIRGLLPRVSRTSQLCRDLEELDAKIGSEESQLSGSDSSRSHVIVSRELRDVQLKIEDLDRKMDHKRQQIQSGVQEIRQLEQRVNQLRDEKLRLQERLQEKQGLLTKKEDLAAIIQKEERDIKMSAQRHGPVEEKLRRKEEEKRELCQARDEAEAVSKAEVDSLRSSVDAIGLTTQQISRYESEGGETGLRQLNGRINSIKREAEGKTRERKELEDKIKKLQKEVANVELQEREWEDQLQLMRVAADVARKERDAQKLREKMREMGLHRYDEEYSKLQQEQEKMTRERARMEGGSLGHEERVRGLQRELKGDMYRDAERKHKDMLISLRTTEMAAKDLEKYYKVLDRAIMRFHKLKMEEINKIIKELWIKTYRGGDIDVIEIRSDGDTEESGGIKTRRVYHYRVVMLKGETALDMRGRCSAGQKMLASIIIRLALAETFCVNCGLLALDEPTTNLDKDNIEGLAQALADIVKDRSSQKNFQLIVITHDTEFVDVLGQAGYTEHYFKVSKEVGETSRIRRLPLSGMEH
ncbi:DNA repair protein RAD50 [Geodia barretti]|nr:DNA repair protein RAD50 [Geodia barretti]